MARLISERLWTALVHLGVEDAHDLAYLFASQDEAREWAVLQQCASDSDRFVVAWQLCRTIVDKDFSVVDRVLLLEHQCTRGAAPKPMPISSRTPDTRPPLERPLSVKRRREAITDSLTGREQVNVVTADPATASSINPAHPVHDQLVDLFCRSGASNLRYQLLERAYPSGVSWSWILSKFEKFQPDQLKAPLRAWQRWDSWRLSKAPEISAFEPDFVTMFTFFEHVAAGGPTAARSVWHQLCMLRDRLGLNFPLQDCKEYVMGKVQRNVVVPARCGAALVCDGSPRAAAAGRRGWTRVAPVHLLGPVAMRAMETLAAFLLHPP